MIVDVFVYSPVILLKKILEIVKEIGSISSYTILQKKLFLLLALRYLS